MQDQLRRARLLRLADGRWRSLIAAAARGKHVSRNYILWLIASHGVPEYAGRYVADRLSGRISPKGRPYRPALDPGDLDTLWYHFDGPIHHPAHWGSPTPTERLYPPWYVAALKVRYYHSRYASFVTSRKPRPAHLQRRVQDGAVLWYVESRRVWRVRDPKGEAIRRVARIYDVAPSTVASWVRKLNAWERQVRDYRAREASASRKTPQS